MFLRKDTKNWGTAIMLGPWPFFCSYSKSSLDPHVYPNVHDADVIPYKSVSPYTRFTIFFISLYSTLF